MARKIVYSVYQNSPSATFWSRLGAVFTPYLFAGCFFAILLIGVTHLGFSPLVWVLISLVVTIAITVLFVKMCDKNVEKCLAKSIAEFEKTKGMTKCQLCGKSFLPNENTSHELCIDCLSRMSMTLNEMTQWRCKHCGMVNEKTAKRCVHCDWTR